MMNERIKELSLQATTYIEPTATSGEGWIFNKEKFAELIVRECMSITEKCSTGSGIHDLFADEIIAEHFGVE